MPTTPPARWRAACSSRATISGPGSNPMRSPTLPPRPRKAKRQGGDPRPMARRKSSSPCFDDPKSMQQIASPVYGERNVTLSYRVCDMLWRPVGLLVRFVAVIHPTRGACILMCTDTTLCAVDIIRLYGLRFKIECSFKQAVRQIGSFAYHFWMKD